MRPIWIGEVIQRLLGKAILYLIGQDIQEAAGSLQFCAGQDCGIEVAIHIMHDVFNSSDTDGVLLVDASNTFNSLNREVCLRNVQHLCPSLAAYAINTYRQATRLFVGGESIMSSEGTTQGDPIAMPLYTTAVLPLLRSVATEGVTQAWYADDACAGGKLAGLRLWWDGLAKNGPQYCYYLNPSKSILLVKPEFYDEAIQIFKGTEVQIRSDGVRYLGIAIGSPAYTIQFLNETVQSFLVQLSQLSEIAASQPQAAYSAYVHGLRSKWSFLCRTMTQMSSALLPLDRMVWFQASSFPQSLDVRSITLSASFWPCHAALGVWV